MAAQSDLRFTFTAGSNDVFDVVEFRLTEGLSETFRLDIDLSCTNPAVDFAEILDRPALFTLWQGEQPVRYVHGSVSSFQQGDTGFRRTRYHAVVEPRLARLKLTSDWRIFQTLNVPDIATAMLKKHALTLDYEQRITNAHETREYCVQAGDTSTLVKVPGVGKKTAERLLVELKDRFKAWETVPSIATLVVEPRAGVAVSSAESDAVSALISLGFKPQEASKAVAAVQEDGLSSEDLIRRALKGMV